MGFIAFCIGIIIIFILAVGYIAKTFFLTRVSGLSMFPTFKEGDVLLIRPVFNKIELPQVGDIYIYDKDDRQVIKRLTAVFPTPCLYYYYQYQCYFEGDNPPESYDSRHYGTIYWRKIKFKVVKKLFNYKAL